MSARDAILGRIRAAKGAVAADDVVATRIKNPRKHTQPVLPSDRVQNFIEKMESVQISVVRLQSTSDVVAAVDWYLEEHGIEGDLSVAPALADLDWAQRVNIGAASGKEQSSVTACIAGVAETGSIVLASDKGSPTSLGFLPENHLVVVHESQVLNHLEDVWSIVRKEKQNARAVNFITGPSRTGDIEQTIEIGAHGPRRMHVMLVAADAADSSDA